MKDGPTEDEKELCFIYLWYKRVGFLSFFVVAFSEIALQADSTIARQTRLLWTRWT